MSELLMNDAPADSIGACTKSGWADQGVLHQRFRHFIAHARLSPGEKHLVILDDRHCHTFIEAMDLARERGVELLVLPPHRSHHLQPLDVAVLLAQDRLQHFDGNMDEVASGKAGDRV